MPEHTICCIYHSVLIFELFKSWEPVWVQQFSQVVETVKLMPYVELNKISFCSWNRKCWMWELFGLPFRNRGCANYSSNVNKILVVYQPAIDCSQLYRSSHSLSFSSSGYPMYGVLLNKAARNVCSSMYSTASFAGATHVSWNTS